jgi:nitroimidazol reductase NimA-like FMN-containing flavoprotein (pyridoxamine 5'-phosphate oxidase superfamily)
VNGHASAPMRRPDRLVTNRAAIDDVLRRAELLHLAMSGADGPYVVPVNFGYDGERIYIHCALEGRKLDVLAQDPRVCFEASVDVRVVPATGCGWTARFRSVVGFGTASLVTDDAEKAYALGVVISHYSGEPETVPAAKAKGVAVLRIDIESMTGKASVED